ncbi:MAG: hypothetical protein LQ338_007747 [Usnochroma carphineum]|nr:MAG: hypothetical protein LQ338_007747 [Usnochroma carphineum]
MAPGTLVLSVSPSRSSDEDEEAYGSRPLSHSTGIESLISSSSDDFLQYADGSDPTSCLRALLDLESYMDDEGPFDGVMAFSQGAGLAASLLIHRMQKDPQQARLSPAFRCAVFFSGGVPEDPEGLEAAACAIDAENGDVTIGEKSMTMRRRLMDVEHDGEVIEIPTAHIWGRNDSLYPTFGPVLSRLCKGSEREVFVHEGGHEILGAKDPTALEKAVRIINRTIARAETVR